MKILRAIVVFIENLSTIMNEKLDQPTRNHLSNVYACLATANFAVLAGIYFHCEGHVQGGLFSSITSFIFFCFLAFSRFRGVIDEGYRFIYFIGFAFCTGISMGPLIQIVCYIDPSTVTSAFLYTFVIFICFSLAALYGPEGKFLVFGAPLVSFLVVLFIDSIFNVFVQSYTIAYMQLIEGIFLMPVFILYDTQLIVEKFRHDDRDYIWHALTLVVDLISVFKHILFFIVHKQKVRKDAQFCTKDK